MPTADEIDALLPQTQCTRCGYAGCRPYAEAIVAGTADINQCPPGGAAGIEALARLTGRPVVALNPVHGLESPARVAVIDEATCIGCAKCLPCPVDAIVGLRQHLHTVISAHCNGCELCIAPCPVDCITLVPASSLGLEPPTPEENRARFEARSARLQRRQREREALIAARKLAARSPGNP